MPKIPRDISGRELSKLLIAEYIKISKQELINKLFK